MSKIGNATGKSQEEPLTPESVLYLEKVLKRKTAGLAQLVRESRAAGHSGEALDRAVEMLGDAVGGSRMPEITRSSFSRLDDAFGDAIRALGGELFADGRHDEARERVNEALGYEHFQPAPPSPGLH